MPETHPLSQWLTELGVEVAELMQRTGLDRRVVEAIAAGRYTPSPDQRRRIATALGLDVDRIAWGHASSVESLYGHGPQFGRSP